MTTLILILAIVNAVVTTAVAGFIKGREYERKQSLEREAEQCAHVSALIAEMAQTLENERKIISPIQIKRL